MKKNLLFLMFGLLLAVGWTSSASAQKMPTDNVPWYTSAHFTQPLKPAMSQVTPAGELNYTKLQAPVQSVDGGKSAVGQLQRAPRRADYTITANAVHTKQWYSERGYYWYDENDEQQLAAYTDPVTDAHQMFWFTRTLYMDKRMPGIKFSEAYNNDLVYEGVDFGYYISGDIQQDIVIAISGQVRVTAIYVYDYAGNLVTFMDADDASMPTGWTLENASYLTRTYERVNTSQGYQNWYFYYFNDNESDQYPAFSISKDLLAGVGGVFVQVVARQSYQSAATQTYSCDVWHYNYQGLNGSGTGYENGYVPAMANSWGSYQWMVNAPVEAPDENGYSVVLVKLTNEFDYTTGQAELYTYTDSALYAYFDKYVDEMVMLTDGLRLKENSDDAGTLFSYSGSLNRFYFIGKGKTYPLGGSQYRWATENNTYTHFSDRAPFYNMYEEFSPTTQSNTTGIDDFYSRMLEGDSYSIIHDCQSVNYMEHFFSMSGKGGTENRSLTNLLFWIPDNRGQYVASSVTRDYDEDNLPIVGLYTITLTAEAQPAADYSTSNRQYDVTCNWVSSLNSILDFPVDQDYELWIYVYDEHGNPVADSLLTETPLHNITTYTYQEPQYPDSYTIIYRVKGWPSDATNNPARGGDFYALSNLDDVLIPGYNDFLALGLDHYESDFKIDEEHNYYRNFLTLDNQNPDNQLTPQRIIDGENLFTLYRFDVATPEQLTKAADLTFSQSGNDILYNVAYANQNILSGYDLATLNIPTSGVVATLGGGTPTPVTVTQYERITSTSDLTSGEEYLIVYETDNVAFNGALAPPDAGHNTISVTRNGNIIESNTTTDAATFTITANGSYYTIRSKSGYYIGRTTSSNGMNYNQTQSYNNSITFSGNNVVIRGRSNTQNTYYLRFNRNSGNDNYRFRYYGQTSQQAIQLYKKVTTTSVGGDFTLLSNAIDNSVITTSGTISPSAPWAATNVVLQSSGTSAGYFYIQNGGSLRFTVPAGYSDATLKFVLRNAPSSSSYYSGTFTFTSSSGETHTITCNTANTDYEAVFEHVNPGDVITITGAYSTYGYSPDFSYIHAYIMDGGGIGVDDPVNLHGIQLVDQFNASTATDTHPYRYGYKLMYAYGTPNEKSSSVQEVPVQHTGSDPDGFYTLAQIDNDRDLSNALKINVMNAEVEMKLANNPQIYYYTLGRKPNTASAYDEISKLQIRVDGSYQEMDRVLNQYIDSTYSPGIVPRFDNNDTITGQYNSYMSYVPIVWTHGDLSSNKRIKWETEKLHNSYGAPIWKTGVAKVEITDATAWQQSAGGAQGTSWIDPTTDTKAWMYFLTVDALGVMPTFNNVPYEPYLFRVWINSPSGKLRGWQYLQASGNVGAHFEGDGTSYTSLMLYEGLTNDGVLQIDYSDQLKFAALEGIDDMEVIVRFYYVVEGTADDHVFGTRGASDPAGYAAQGAKSPDPATAVNEIYSRGEVISRTYVNAQGMTSDRPFDGVNIVITRYSDGSTSTTKVLK